MATFRYKAVDTQGQTVTGVLEAADRKDAVRQLRSRQCQPVQISVGGARDVKALQASGGQELAQSRPSRSGFFRRKRRKDVLALEFLTKAYQLHKSGMPIGDVVKSLHQRLNDAELRDLASGLWRELSEGYSFAAAVRKRPDVFDSAAAHLIEAGEATGNLVPVLENILESLQDRIALRKRVISGLSYPIFICSLAFVIAMVMLFFLMPKLETMMRSMGSELSLSAKILIGSSEFAVIYGPFIMVIVFACMVALERWRRTDKGRWATDGWLLKIPVVKSIVTRLDVCRMSNLLATLLSSGVNTTEAMKLTEKTLGNRHLQERFKQARALINDGASFSSAFRRHALLEGTDQDILGVGESVGRPTDSFRDIYKYHNEQLGQQLNLLTMIVAGAALFVAFMMVLMILLTFILSMFDVNKGILQ